MSWTDLANRKKKNFLMILKKRNLTRKILKVVLLSLS